MAIEYFEVETNTLRQSAGEAEQGLSDMREKLRALTQSMTELDAMWDGPASETFRARFTEDCAVFQELCEALQDFINGVRDAAGEYDLCEDKVMEAVNAIQV